MNVYYMRNHWFDENGHTVHVLRAGDRVLQDMCDRGWQGAIGQLVANEQSILVGPDFTVRNQASIQHTVTREKKRERRA